MKNILSADCVAIPPEGIDSSMGTEVTRFIGDLVTYTCTAGYLLEKTEVNLPVVDLPTNLS